MNQNRINQIIRESIKKVVNDKKNFNMLDEYMPNVGNNAPMVSINESNAKPHKLHVESITFASVIYKYSNKNTRFNYAINKFAV